MWARGIPYGDDVLKDTGRDERWSMTFIDTELTSISSSQ